MEDRSRTEYSDANDRSENRRGYLKALINVRGASPPRMLCLYMSRVLILWREDIRIWKI